MRRNLSLRALATIFVAGILVPAAGHAQTGSDPAAAQHLEQQAEYAGTHSLGFRNAAELLVKAAARRSATDTMAVNDLLRAGCIFYGVGNLGRAQAVLVQAAERAQAMGDVYRAAEGYAQAAVVANQQRDPARDSLIEKATRLAASPFLTGAQRFRITSQFKAPVLLAEHK